MKFELGKTPRKRAKNVLLWVVGLIIIFGVISAVVVRRAYNENLKPLSASSQTHVVTIEPGMSTPEIAEVLKSKNVIRSDWAFEWYVRNNGYQEKIKAGTYVLNQNQSVPDVVNTLVEGNVATDLVTILPAQRIDQIKASLIKAGYSESEVDSALDPAKYQDHPALADKPKGASLEGYLYPESFQKTADTSASQIVKNALDETNLRLTPELRKAITKQGLSVHEGIILASVIEKEVSKPEDKPVVSQVFLKRLKEGMRLESDATNDYAKINPAYDTYKINGLPPGPIVNVSEASLKAVAYPSQTDWLYFVSGDDGVTHFSKTLEEHQALTQRYCTKLCRQN